MNEPKLRFKADDGSQFPDWEEKKLSDIFVERREMQCIDDEYKLLSFTIEQGVINPEDKKTNKRDFLMKDKVSKKFLRTEYDDIIYNPANLKYGAINRNKLGKGLLSPIYAIFYTEQNAVFMESVVRNPDFIKRSLKYLEGTVIKLMTLKPRDFLRIKSYIPSLPEQQKIADFLSTIDTIIEKQRAMVLAWEERKKGVMQKLFSQEVRFKADDGSDFPDWEEKSFVNTFDSLNNSTFSRDCLNYENGSVKYIHYGDILVKYNSSVDVCDAIVPFVNEDLDCERFAILQDGDIVIADTAEDDTVGKVIEIENTSNVKTIAGLHTIACRPKEKFASKYLGYYMNSDEYHNQLRPYMQGIKVTSISKSNIALTKIMVPSLPEQQKIADCLSALDTVIQKQKETLEKWQELKKGLLQQMFV